MVRLASAGSEIPVVDYVLIDGEKEFRAYLKTFAESDRFIMAVDIEAESNLHAYGEKLCLIQVFDGVDRVIIDPLEMDADTPRALFEDRAILKVMYDASSDLSLLKNTSDMEIKSILDLRPAVELLGYGKKDLHSVLTAELGISLEKKSRFQKHNWTKRPISAQAIDYALNDVAHLLALKDAIWRKLYERQLLDTFLLKNLQVQNKDYTRKAEDRYKRTKGYHSLHGAERTAFRRAFNVREKYAIALDMPPHNVIGNSDLVRIAGDPEHLDGIRFSKRIGSDAAHDLRRELRVAVSGG